MADLDSVGKCELEQTTKEGSATNDDVNRTETDMNNNIRVRRDRRMGVKSMKNREVDSKWHS